MTRLVPKRQMIALIIAASLLGACSSKPKPIDPNLGAASLYKKAQKSIKSGNYETAIAGLERLEGRFPFADQTKQAQIDLIFAYYMNDEPDAAIDAAETFILENPTNPRVDYANYIKGLVYFPKSVSAFEKLFKVDLTERPPNDAQQSYNHFNYLVSNFPDSPYAPNARQRMIFLRNYIAAYEIHVAKFYMKRGAYVAALRRAENVIIEYDSTPSVLPALEVMVSAYEKMGLEEMRQQTARVLNYNRARFAEQSKPDATRKDQRAEIAALTPPVPQP